MVTGFWLGLFAGGGITSFFGWLAEIFARKRREAIDSVLDRLLRILSEARQINSIGNLTQEKSLFLFRRPSGKSAYFVCLGAR